MRRGWALRRCRYADIAACAWLLRRDRQRTRNCLAARAAVYGNRNRLRSGVGKEATRKRGEVVERSFAHVLERGGMRRTWLRGRENVHKRYLVHVAGYNLGILMRALFGAGTPKEVAAIRNAFLFVIDAQDTVAIVVLAVFDAEVAALASPLPPMPSDQFIS